MKITPAETLFLQAHLHNWDDGTDALLRILDDPACDRGTALLVYWRARPDYYAAFASEADVPDVNRDGYRFLRAVEARLLSGRYPEIIAYDPADDRSRSAPPAVRPIPDALCRPTRGAISAKDLISGRRGGGALDAAATSGDVERIRALVAGGFDVDALHDRRTPLIAAAWALQIESVRVLLELGASAKKKVSGSSALHHVLSTVIWKQEASSDAVIAVMDALLAAGAPVDLMAPFGTPLMTAAQGGRPELVRFLLERKAKVARTDKRGRTAVHSAARGGSVRALRVLLDAGADLHAVDAAGWNALHHAVDFPGWNHFDTADRSAMVEALLELDLARDRADEAGVTAVDLARRHVGIGHLGPLERARIAALLGIPMPTA